MTCIKVGFLVLDFIIITPSVPLILVFPMSKLYFFAIVKNMAHTVRTNRGGCI